MANIVIISENTNFVRISGERPPQHGTPSLFSSICSSSGVNTPYFSWKTIPFSLIIQTNTLSICERQDRILCLIGIQKFGTPSPFNLKYCAAGSDAMSAFANKDSMRSWFLFNRPKNAGFYLSLTHWAQQYFGRTIYHFCCELLSLFLSLTHRAQR